MGLYTALGSRNTEVKCSLNLHGILKNKKLIGTGNRYYVSLEAGHLGGRQWREKCVNIKRKKGKEKTHQTFPCNWIGMLLAL